MGAHRDVVDGVDGWRFCVWAPDVNSVHVVGDFNAWDPNATPLSPIGGSELWQGFVPGLEQGDLYKYVSKRRREICSIKPVPLRVLRGAGSRNGV